MCAHHYTNSMLDNGPRQVLPIGTTQTRWRDGFLSALLALPATVRADSYMRASAPERLTQRLIQV
jgi:hypothetical protein